MNRCTPGCGKVGSSGRGRGAPGEIILCVYVCVCVAARRGASGSSGRGRGAPGYGGSVEMCRGVCLGEAGQSFCKCVAAKRGASGPCGGGRGVFG